MKKKTLAGMLPLYIKYSYLKFSYCFSERITPIGLPVLISSLPFTFHVSGLVFTSNHNKGTSSFFDFDIIDSSGIMLPNEMGLGWEKDFVAGENIKQQIIINRFVLIGFVWINDLRMLL